MLDVEGGWDRYSVEGGGWAWHAGCGLLFWLGSISTSTEFPARARPRGPGKYTGGEAGGRLLLVPRTR